MDCSHNMCDYRNISNHIKSDGVDTMSDTESDQARIDRLKRYQEQEDREADELRQDKSLRFYTIGYAGLNSIQDIENIMEHHNIKLILDVRSKPNTRRFSKRDLFAKFDLNYDSKPEMGGLGYTKDQYEDWLVNAEDGIHALIAAANTGTKILILCMEKDPNQCHRKYFVARALEEGGHKVRHL